MLYDGVSAMSGCRHGVAKQISDIEPKAILTHCYGHALNLAASDDMKKSKLLKDALETTYEITKLIKFSPRRESIFLGVKQDMLGTPLAGIRILCPTRWTVRADALAMKKSKLLKDALETTYEITKLIKFSPRREAIFLGVKQDTPGTPLAGIRLLCPTRWTVRADALASVTSNFQVLQQTWEESIEVVSD